MRQSSTGPCGPARVSGPPGRRDRQFGGEHPRQRRRDPPRRVPDIGQVLRLRPEDMRYRTRPLTIRVRRVRMDLSDRYDGDWVWIEGEELRPGGTVVAWLQVLVNVDAIPE